MKKIIEYLYDNKTISWFEVIGFFSGAVIFIGIIAWLVMACG